MSVSPQHMYIYIALPKPTLTGENYAGRFFNSALPKIIAFFRPGQLLTAGGTAGVREFFN